MPGVRVLAGLLLAVSSHGRMHQGSQWALWCPFLEGRLSRWAPSTLTTQGPAAGPSLIHFLQRSALPHCRVEDTVGKQGNATWVL